MYLQFDLVSHVCKRQSMDTHIVKHGGVLTPYSENQALLVLQHKGPSFMQEIGFVLYVATAAMDASARLIYAVVHHYLMAPYGLLFIAIKSPYSYSYRGNLLP